MEQLLEFDINSRTLRVTLIGEFKDDNAVELYASVRRFLSSADVRGGILDLSSVTKLSVSTAVVVRLSKNPPLFASPLVRVIVAPQDIVYGMARMFQISRSEIHGGLHVVHTLVEAYGILGLQNPAFTVVEWPSDT